MNKTNDFEKFLDLWNDEINSYMSLPYLLAKRVKSESIPFEDPKIEDSLYNTEDFTPVNFYKSIAPILSDESLNMVYGKHLTKE